MTGGRVEQRFALTGHAACVCLKAGGMLCCIDAVVSVFKRKERVTFIAVVLKDPLPTRHARSILHPVSVAGEHTASCKSGENRSLPVSPGIFTHEDKVNKVTNHLLLLLR